MKAKTKKKYKMEDNSTKYCDNNYIFDTNALKYRKYNYKILTTLKKYSILSTMKQFKKRMFVEVIPK